LKVLYGATDESIYLSPAPLYHAAPLAFTMNCIRTGVPRGGDGALRSRIRSRVHRALQDHAQPVGAHDVRAYAQLPEETRLKYDVSSLRCAIHAAAPCPIPIKEQMIDWWGPVITSITQAPKANGFVQLNSEEWLAHKGSVGKPLTCELHICDEHRRRSAGRRVRHHLHGRRRHLRIL
jgi:hypothetical protein